MNEDAPPPVALRMLIAAYAAGFFSLSLVPILTLLVPLWTLEIGAAPFLIGLAMGARNVLPVLFAIHGGALLDRLGPRRIMIACALIVAVLLPLYPLLPWIWAVIGLQLLVGFLQGTCWMGAQTQINLLTRNDPAIVGRFTFFSTLGNFVGPLVAGAAWDAFGPSGAFTLVSLWAIGILLAVLGLGKQPMNASTASTAETALRDLLPRARDYLATLMLLRSPAVAFVIVCSFVMTCTYGIRHSFYAVYLESIDMPGTLIGVLVGVISLGGSVAGLSVGVMSKRVSPLRMTPIMIGIACVALAATPLATTFEGLLVLGCAAGLGSGIAFPLILFQLSRAVDSSQQGLGIGLRTSLNRFGGMIVPIIMGAIAEAGGLFVSFIATGGVILTCLAAITIWAWRHPELAQSNA